MLWDLNGEMAGQVYRSWSTCVKEAWKVPRSTHTFIVDNLLAANLFSAKQQLAGRYVNYVHGLLNSKSPEVKTVVNMVGRCARSNTGKNLMNLERETGIDPWRNKGWKVRDMVKRCEVPQKDKWRLNYLGKLIKARNEMKEMGEHFEEIISLIESLCSS